MSYTNHTTNYNPPQYVGTDKPTYLGDFNTAMGAIDTQMKANADAASAAGSTATSASNAIGALASLTTTDKSTVVAAINEVDGVADTAATAAATAGTTASNALTKVTALESALNFTQFKTYAASDFTITGGNVNFIDSMQYAVNSDGSVGKIYGSIRVNCTASGGMTVSFPSAFRPTSNISIVGCCWVNFYNNSGVLQDSIRPRAINIATDGTISTTFSAGYYNSQVQLNFVACLLFMKDFGDQPNA